MTADVELLPSSVAAFTEALRGDRGSLDAWLEVNDEREVRAHVEAYARANINIATAAKDAEIEALRAEVERLTFEMGRLREQYDERTACMIVHRGSALACSAAVRAAYSEEHERAKRLAEALRELRNHTSVNSDQIALIDAALEQENDDA